MTVKLVSYTQPTAELAAQGIVSVADQIAYCARVSNPSNQLNKASNEKLIDYLIQHKHWSPLEMVEATLEIETTRDIGRQILRHRSFVFQEFSQRYADPTQMKFEYGEARLQDTKNRQNSIEMEISPEAIQIKSGWHKAQEDIVAEAVRAYDWAIDAGIAKEVARKVLPEGLTTTRMYMKGNIRSWVHYIMLRSGNGTQKEHRDVTLACADAIMEIFPMMQEFVG